MGRFFIDAIPIDAEFCDPSDFHGSLDEIMFLDTRLRLSDVDHLASSSHCANLFEIKDEIKGSRKAKVLLSLCLYNLDFSKKHRSRPFEMYLNGVKQWIDYMESDDGQSEMLRVYVADDCWDVLYAEGVLKHEKFDFVRMRLSSKHTYLGTLWRYLAFDDYKYEYVYIEETDGHNYLGDDGQWHLRYRIKGYGVTRFEKLPKNYHFYTSVLEPPQSAQDNTMPGNLSNFIRLVTLPGNLSNFIRLVTPHLTRCGKRIPVSIKSLMAWNLSMTEVLEAYLPSQNIWTRLAARPHLRKAYDGYFNFPISKITQSYLRLFPDWTTLRELYLSRGDDWYYKRMCDDLCAEGNTIVAYDADDKGYPFQ